MFFRRRKAVGRQRHRVRWWPLMLAILIVGFGARHFLPYLEASNTANYVRVNGHMFRSSEAVEITPPEGVRISEVHVEEGREVHAGDILILAERVGLDAKRGELAKQASALALELQCLRNMAASPLAVGGQGDPGARGEGAKGVGNPRADPPAASGVAAAISAENCAIDRAEISAHMLSAWEAKDALETRLAVLERYWASARRHVQLPDGAGTPSPEILQQFLRVALARNLVRADLARVKARMRKMHLGLKRERLGRMAALADEMETILADLENIEATKREVEIRAPQNGVIRNVRSGMIGEVIPVGTSVLRIVTGSERLLIVAEVPEAVYEGTSVGDPTRLKVGALAAGAPMVSGHISERRLLESEASKDATAMRYILEVELDASGQRAVDRRLAFGLDPGVRSAVEIEIGRRGPLDLLLTHIAGQGLFCRYVPEHLRATCSTEKPVPAPEKLLHQIGILQGEYTLPRAGVRPLARRRESDDTPPAAAQLATNAWADVKQRPIYAGLREHGPSSEPDDGKHVGSKNVQIDPPSLPTENPERSVVWRATNPNAMDTSVGPDVNPATPSIQTADVPAVPEGSPDLGPDGTTREDRAVLWRGRPSAPVDARGPRYEKTPAEPSVDAMSKDVLVPH